eukprot:COSAG05_NODE_1105_length_5872_cov_4.084185_5_plen_362_part_00
MSMIEFYVDEGGIPMGGAGLGIKSKIKKHARKRWKTSKAKIAAAAHKHLAEVAKRAKQHLPKLLNKSKDLLKNTQEAAANKVEQLGDAALDQMQQKVKVTQDQIKGAGHDCGCPTKKKHHHHKHMHGSGHMEGHGHMEGSGHMKGHGKQRGGRHSDTKGGAMAGEDGSYTGHGLMLQQVGFVSAAMPMPAGVPVGFSNHLQTYPVSGPGGRVPSLGVNQTPPLTFTELQGLASQADNGDGILPAVHPELKPLEPNQSNEVDGGVYKPVDMTSVAKRYIKPITFRYNPQRNRLEVICLGSEIRQGSTLFTETFGFQETQLASSGVDAGVLISDPLHGDFVRVNDEYFDNKSLIWDPTARKDT